MNFLEILDSSNSIFNEKTEEIIITTPIFEIEGQFQVKSACKLSSNCSTVIKADVFEILSENVSISNITFESSVIIQNSNKFTIRNCNIKKSKLRSGALSISNCEHVTISHVTISESEKIPGLYINQNSIVSVDNLTVFGLAETLIVGHDSSIIMITDSNLHDSQANGIYLDGQSYIEIHNCTIRNTNYPAVYITNSQCHITNNTISHINATSIQLSEKSNGTIEETTFSDVNGNCIFCSESELHTRNNIIANSKFPGIAASSKSKVTVFGDKISKIETNGVVSRTAAEFKISNCEISEIKQGGISISDTEHATIENCIIKNCEVTAIEAYNNSNVIANNNIIENTGKYAFMTFASGFIKAVNNNINNINVAMVKLIYKGEGEFVRNHVSNCPIQSECKTSSFYFFNENGGFEGITNDKSRANDSVKFENIAVNDHVLCLKCNKNQRDCYLLECGHKTYCKECAQKALENGEKCPLCRFPIVKISSGFGVNNADLCIICLENKADCLILPCGHMGVCSDCIENWFQNKKNCPICRTEPCFYRKIGNE